MDIQIEFDNPHGVFVPGYEVSGSVIFTVTDHPLKARAVLISVDGRASTHWTVSERHARPVAHSHGSHTNLQSQTTHYTVTYSASVPYANGEAVVWAPGGGESAGHLALGIHRFPFRFMLPPMCPPSFEGTNGFVRYFCKAKIDRPWKFDHTTRRVFTVVPTFDLNLLPSAALPVGVQDTKDLGVLFFKHGRMSVSNVLEAKMCKGAYVPGENIVLNADIVNASSRPVTKAELKLVEVSRYVAHRHGHTYTAGCPAGGSSHGQTRTSKRTVTSFEEKLDVDKGASVQYSRLVPIPPVVPTFNNCPIIEVEYYLKLKLFAKGTMGNTLAVELPVIIGTVPIRQAPPLPQCPPPMERGSYIGGAIMPNGPPPPSAGFDLPPSYEECVFGKGTVKDDEENSAFAPRYAFYPNIQPSVPPAE